MSEEITGVPGSVHNEGVAGTVEHETVESYHGDPRPITVHPDTSLPANASPELVRAAVEKATAEAPKTGHVEHDVVVQDDEAK